MALVIEIINLTIESLAFQNWFEDLLKIGFKSYFFILFATPSYH